MITWLKVFNMNNAIVKIYHIKRHTRTYKKSRGPILNSTFFKYRTPCISLWTLILILAGWKEWGMYILESPLNLINIIIIMHWLALPRQMRGGGGGSSYPLLHKRILHEKYCFYLKLHWYACLIYSDQECRWEAKLSMWT